LVTLGLGALALVMGVAREVRGEVADRCRALCGDDRRALRVLGLVSAAATYTVVDLLHSRAVVGSREGHGDVLVEDRHMELFWLPKLGEQ
jgi:hypothetical protein